MIKRLLASLVFTAAVLGGSRAEADPLKDTARALLQEGASLYDKKKYSECHAKALAAWGAHPHPQIAALRAKCAEPIGKYREAAEMATVWLVEYEMTEPKQDVQAVYATLAAAKKHVASVKVKVEPAAAEIRVGDEIVGKGTVSVFREPGTYEFRASLEQYVTKREKKELKAGDDIELPIKLEAVGTGPGPGPGPGPEVPGGSSWPKWPLVGVSAGLAVVGIGVGVGLFVAGDGKLGEAKTLGMGIAPGSCPAAAGCTELKAALRDAETLTNAGIGALVAGSVLAGVTIVLIAIPAGSGSDKASSSLRIAPTLGGVLVQGGF